MADQIRKALAAFETAIATETEAEKKAGDASDAARQAKTEKRRQERELRRQRREAVLATLTPIAQALDGTVKEVGNVSAFNAMLKRVESVMAEEGAAAAIAGDLLRRANGAPLTEPEDPTPESVG